MGDYNGIVMDLEEDSGAPGRIRTSDLLVRSQALYPAELRAHIAGMQLVKDNRCRG